MRTINDSYIVSRSMARLALFVCVLFLHLFWSCALVIACFRCSFNSSCCSQVPISPTRISALTRFWYGGGRYCSWFIFEKNGRRKYLSDCTLFYVLMKRANAFRHESSTKRRNFYLIGSRARIILKRKKHSTCCLCPRLLLSLVRWISTWVFHFSYRVW